MKSKDLYTSFGKIIEAEQGQSFNDLNVLKIEEMFTSSRALLFRGFKQGVDQFKSFTDQFTEEYSDYKGGGSRWKMIDREVVGNDKTVMTTTGATQSFEIPLHGEMYYMDTPPELIWFYADVAPTKGGQTTLCNGIELFDKLDEHIQDFLLSNTIVYHRKLESGVWENTFLTSSLNEVFTFCESKNMEVSYHRKENSMDLSFSCSPLVKDPITQKNAFINNVLYIYMAEWAFQSGWIKGHLNDNTAASPIIVRLADGGKIPYSIIENISKVAAEITVNINWQPGDIAMIDNTVILHGRRETIKGIDRNILVRMGDRKEQKINVT